MYCIVATVAAVGIFATFATLIYNYPLC
jgi:hypothetical protein